MKTHHLYELMIFFSNMTLQHPDFLFYFLVIKTSVVDCHEMERELQLKNHLVSAFVQGVSFFLRQKSYLFLLHGQLQIRSSKMSDYGFRIVL